MQELVVERRDEVDVITLNRPFRKNALTIDLLRRLNEVLLSSNAKGVIITGAGDVFSSGLDMSHLPAEMEEAEGALSELSNAIVGLPKVVVAALNGPCIGGAVEIVIACDVRVASTTMFLEIPTARLGVLYRPAGLSLFTRKLSQETLARLLLLNERIFAQDAVSAGLVSQVSDNALATSLSLFKAEGLNGEVVAATKEQLVAMSKGSTDPDHYSAQRERFMQALRSES
jgi:enoyl-CoA hydratase/carnithine racemase